jgi:hypothetical protein
MCRTMWDTKGTKCRTTALRAGPMIPPGKTSMSSDTEPDFEAAEAPPSALPAQKSDYHAPRPPPPPTAHRTLERDAVRIGTREPVVGALGAPVDRSAPTVQLRAVRLPSDRGAATRSRLAVVAVAVVVCGGSAGWAVSAARVPNEPPAAEVPPENAAAIGAPEPRVSHGEGVDPPEPLASPPAPPASAMVRSRATPEPSSARPRGMAAPRARVDAERNPRGAPSVAPTPAVSAVDSSESEAARPLPPPLPPAPSGAATTATVRSLAPEAPAPTARPRSWLSDEPPKAWVR